MVTSIELVYSKFCTTRFAMPTVEHVTRLEEQIGVSFPEDYRDFLLTFNGGCFSNPRIVAPGKDTPAEYLQYMYAIGAPARTLELGSKVSLAFFDDNDPPQVIPIGRTPTNSLILLITHPEENGSIVLKVAFGGFFFLSSGIEEFFGLLCNEA